ncbi:hypothetical protein ABGV42_00750 [Paenibacillus pabuli]|uniref:hypothetical protein n=1 Tax=Paenibacillus pabuli TaxID=1472 RepID=UPI003242CEE0
MFDTYAKMFQDNGPFTAGEIVWVSQMFPDNNSILVRKIYHPHVSLEIPMDYAMPNEGYRVLESEWFGLPVGTGVLEFLENVNNEEVVVAYKFNGIPVAYFDGDNWVNYD